MASYTLTIPGWVPTNTNVLLRLHWSQRARRLSEDAMTVLGASLAADVPRAKGKRRVRLTFTSPGRWRPDPDNLLKSMLDALVKANMLLDDSAEYAEWERPVVRRGEKRTVIELEDVE